MFEKYSALYKIYREIFENGLYALEVRDISSETAEQIFKIILDENEICYKRLADSSNSLLIPGSLNQLKNFARRVISSGKEDIGYKLQKSINNFADYDKIKYRIGEREFLFNRAYIMGILNVTPDSFSDGGKFSRMSDAVEHAINMIDGGADFIDIGGESTRPGADPVDEEEEIKRVIPVIKEVLNRKPDTIISIDTTKSRVAYKALENGAKIINDISGLTFDQEMINTASRFNATVIIMHIKGTPANMQDNPVYNDVVEEVYDFLHSQSELVLKSGIKNIIVDPGIGFGKTSLHNFELLRRLRDFKSLGYPILTGISRKSFLGRLFKIDIEERDPATAVAETGAVMRGARIIRTHNVKYCNYVTKLTENLV